MALSTDHFRCQAPRPHQAINHLIRNAYRLDRSLVVVRHLMFRRACRMGRRHKPRCILTGRDLEIPYFLVPPDWDWNNFIPHWPQVLDGMGGLGGSLQDIQYAWNRYTNTLSRCTPTVTTLPAFRIIHRFHQNQERLCVSGIDRQRDVLHRVLRLLCTLAPFD